MGLGSLFCGSSAERRRSRAASKAASSAARDAPPKDSILPGTQAVISRQQEWVRNEGMTLRRGEKARAEAKFASLMETYRGSFQPMQTSSSGRALNRGSVFLPKPPLEDMSGVPPPPAPLEEPGMTRTELSGFFANLGMAMDSEMFDTLFKLFDADNDGRVNKDEFSVAFSFLMFRGSAKDNVEMAFRIFDTNRDELMSRREFAEMICSVVGARLSNLFTIDGGREAFQAHLDKEHARELLDFLDETDYLARAQHRTRSGSGHNTLARGSGHAGQGRGSGHADAGDKVTREIAERIFREFLEVDAPRQVNVADTMREQCRKAVFTEWRGDLSLADTFDEVAAEALYLLETGVLDRFKVSMRQNPGVLADAAWADLGLAASDSMTLAHFREWAERHPGLFVVFDELSVLLESASAELEAGAERERARKDKKNKKKEQRRRMKEMAVAASPSETEEDAAA